MGNYTIQLHGDYFTISTTITAQEADDGYEKAIQQLKDYYGWDWLDTSIINSWDYDYNGEEDND